ncbi:hypothetical protein AAMO2058_001688700 [Amorphochlora amoebiformis]
MHSELRVCYFVGGGLSMAGTLLTIATYLRARKYIRNELMEMLLWLMICDFIYSTKWVLPSATGHLGKHNSTHTWDCMYEAVVDSFFGLSTILWYLMVAWSVYKSTRSFEVRRDRIPVFVHVIVWGISLIVTTLALSLNMETEDALDTGTCMLMQRQSSLVFGIPIILFFVGTLVMIVLTIRLIACKTTETDVSDESNDMSTEQSLIQHPPSRFNEPSDPAYRSERGHADRARQQLKKVTFYLVLFIFFWGSLVIIRFWRFARSDDTPAALEIVTALCLSTQGFVNSTLWILDDSLRPWIFSGYPCCKPSAQIPRGKLNLTKAEEDYKNFEDMENQNNPAERLLAQALSCEYKRPLSDSKSISQRKTPTSIY